MIFQHWTESFNFDLNLVKFINLIHYVTLERHAEIHAEINIFRRFLTHYACV